MEGTQKPTVIPFEDNIRGVADDLLLVAEKMRSVVQAMDDHLQPPRREDPHMAGLVGVMDDLVAVVEGSAVRADRLATAKIQASSAAPEQKAAAA